MSADYSIYGKINITAPSRIIGKGFAAAVEEQCDLFEVNDIKGWIGWIGEPYSPDLQENIESAINIAKECDVVLDGCMTIVYEQCFPPEITSYLIIGNMLTFAPWECKPPFEVKND